MGPCALTSYLQTSSKSGGHIKQPNNELGKQTGPTDTQRAPLRACSRSRGRRPPPNNLQRDQHNDLGRLVFYANDATVLRTFIIPHPSSSPHCSMSPKLIVSNAVVSVPVLRNYHDVQFTMQCLHVVAMLDRFYDCTSICHNVHYLNVRAF